MAEFENHHHNHQRDYFSSTTDFTNDDHHYDDDDDDGGDVDENNENFFSGTNGAAAAFTVNFTPEKVKKSNHRNNHHHHHHLNGNGLGDYGSVVVEQTDPMVDNDLDDDDGGEFVKPFKLPPRLAARLLKKRSPTKILKNLENVKQQPNGQAAALVRRETIVVRSTKNLRQNFLNHEIIASISSQTEPENLKSSKISSHSQQTIDNEAEDARYVNWINSVIATSFKIENITIDTARIINDCIMCESSGAKNNKLKSLRNTNNNNNHAATKTPLKDGITSIVYREEKLMDILREKAQQLFQSDDVKLASEVLWEDLKIPRYYIRKDRSIHADVGSKKYILELLLNYNPLWLKVALETIFGHKINRSTSSKDEVHTLVQFLTHRLLSFKECALKKNFKNVITYFMNEQNVVEAKRHIFYHFLMIVHFLDVAKRKRLIDHDPCLFRMDASCKSSRDMVLMFAREYVTGVGDITKSLRNAGILLVYVQNPIEEFDFTAKKLSCDLRCGLRLARLTEIILLRNDILPRLYFPPNNITRKLHNLELALKMLQPLTGDLSKSLSAKDICMGVRNKTIFLLDRLIEVYNIRKREIELQQSIESIIKIQRWLRRFLECKTQRKYFLQLKAATIFIQRAYRSHLETKVARNEFLALKCATIMIQQKFRAIQSMKSQSEQYLKLRMSVILIQRKFRANRLAQLQREKYLQMKQAALTIQIGWRLYQRQKRLTQAAVVIQRRFRANQEMKRCQAQYLLMIQSAIKIQRIFRCHLLTRECRHKFLKMKQSAILVQKVWRGYIQRKRYANWKQSALIIQRRFRAQKEMLKCRQEYRRMVESAVKIQRIFRSYVLMQHCRREFVKMKHSAILIQKIWRGHQQRVYYAQLKHSVLVIQRRFRSKQETKRCQARYQLMIQSAVKIQRIFRSHVLTRECRQEFLKMRQSAILIQKVWRGHQQRERYRELKQNTILIQRRFRAQKEMVKCRNQYRTMIQSAVKIQRIFRSYVLTRKCRQEFVEKRRAVILIQTVWRGHHQRKNYVQFKHSVLVLQRRFRANRLMKMQREHYLSLIRTTIMCQQRFRQNRQFRIDHERYLTIKSSTIIIQRFYRTRLQRKSFCQLRQATVQIQIRFRAQLQARKERGQYLRLKNAVFFIQRTWREVLRLRQMTKAAMIVQQRFRARRAMQQCRQRYLRIRWATLIVQHRYRALSEGRRQRQEYLQIKQAALTIQRCYRRQKQTNKLKNLVLLYVARVKHSAITIQKYWRGFLVRKRLDSATPLYRIVRRRLELATENAQEEKRLINVVCQTIEKISNSCSIDQLYHDIEKIQTATTLSQEICQFIIQHEWFIRKILTAFKMLNRSEPHKKVIINILIIFINILQKTSTRFLYADPEVLETLIKNIRNFSKSQTILLKTITILNILLRDERTLRIYKRDKLCTSTLESLIAKHVPPNSALTLKNLTRQSSGNNLMMRRQSSASSLTFSTTKKPPKAMTTKHGDESSTIVKMLLKLSKIISS